MVAFSDTSMASQENLAFGLPFSCIWMSKVMLSTQASHMCKFIVQIQLSLAELKRCKYNKLGNSLGMNKWVAVCHVQVDDKLIVNGEMSSVHWAYSIYVAFLLWCKVSAMVHDRKSNQKYAGCEDDHSKYTIVHAYSTWALVGLQSKWSSLQ